MPSVVKITDQAGNVVAERLYDAFGNVLSESGDWSGFPFGFHPNWLEFKAGERTFYLTPGGRIYDPMLGRFLQRDPYSWGPDDERVLAARAEDLTDLITKDARHLNEVLEIGRRTGYTLPLSIRASQIQMAIKEISTSERRRILNRFVLQAAKKNPMLANRYLFASSNPVGAMDPEGKYDLRVVLAVLALIALLVYALTLIMAGKKVETRELTAQEKGIVECALEHTSADVQNDYKNAVVVIRAGNEKAMKLANRSIMHTPSLNRRIIAIRPDVIVRYGEGPKMLGALIQGEWYHTSLHKKGESRSMEEWVRWLEENVSEEEMEKLLKEYGHGERGE